MEGLFNPTSIMWHLINTAMLLAVLYFLLYKPVKKFMAAREEKVASQLDNAAEGQKQAQQLLEERKKQLDNASQEVAQLIKTGESQGKARADAVVAAAQDEAKRIADKTETQMRIKEQNARREVYEEAAKLSVDIATMVLGREVTVEDHKRLLKEFLEKAGRSE